MPKVDVLNIKGEKVGDIDLKAECWNTAPNDAVLYDAIILARAALRQGTQSTKTRAEVRGGGRKPRPQKGSGRSRQGSIRAPQWVGGGVVFAPKPRDYDKKMNKKAYRLALKSALSYKVKDKRIVVIDDLKLENPKTKEMVAIMNKLKIDNKALLVVNELTDNLELASRNLSLVRVIEPNEVNVLDLVNADYLVITLEAVNKLEEVLG
ncbi:MAG: 50S ribosomal protein L4 [Bacilli bacterium]